MRESDSGPPADRGKPTLVPARGKVWFEGKPLTAGFIVFYPAEGNAYTGDNPSSQLQLDGGFSMKTFPFGEGVSPGKYKVILGPELASRVSHPEYADPAKTPWEVEVSETGLEGKLLLVQ